MRRRLVAGAVAALLALAVVPTASADDWCFGDPTVVIRTPAGNTVVVHATIYALGSQHLQAVRDATIAQTVQATSDGLGTDVQLDVVVPDDQYATGFPVRVVVSTGALGGGTVYDDESGQSGKVVKLKFTLSVP